MGSLVVSLILLGYLPAASRQGVAGQGRPGPVKAASAASPESVGGISGEPAVQAVLSRIRDALGGQKVLLGVRSLAVDANYQFEGQPPAPFSLRFLLPDRFLERRGTTIYALDGDEYWQRPVPRPGPMQEARIRHMREFTSACLLLMVRARPGAPLRATLAGSAGPGVRTIAFESPNGLQWTLEVDATSGRIKALSYATGPATPPNEPQERVRIVVDEYAQFDGVWFPSRTRATKEGVPFVKAVHHTGIRINRDVAVGEFAEPPR